MYKFRNIIGKNDFLYHFKKMIVRYKMIGYNIYDLQQVVNPIKVNSFALQLHDGRSGFRLNIGTILNLTLEYM